LSVEIKACFQQTILLLCFGRLSVFIVVFPFCGGIKRISTSTYEYFSSVAVLLLCIRPIDHAGGVCMSPILLYRENWVRIVLFLSEPVDVVGFELIR